MGRGLDGCFITHALRLVRFSSSTGGGLANFPVVHSERETPLPIPNRAVKPFSADGTWGATPWESRSPPVFLFLRARLNRSGSLRFRHDLQEKAAQAPVVKERIDVPALCVAGRGSRVIRDPTRQLRSEVFAGCDGYHLIVFTVEEEDRQAEITGVLQCVEAVPVNIGASVDSPLNGQGCE